MKELLFFAFLAIIIIIFFKRVKVLDFLLYNFNISISNNTLLVILTFFLTLLLVAGMLFDNTKEKYGNISENYDNLKPKEDKRPHRYFDVNTYD